MKKYMLIIVVMFVTIGANAQIVVNSQFKARSYDEMVAPLLMVQRFHQECLDNLDALAEQTEQAEQFISKKRILQHGKCMQIATIPLLMSTIPF